jgi:transcriptional regulator with XRE-family HTH domain
VIGQGIWFRQFYPYSITSVKSRIDTFVIDRVKEKRLEKNLSQADLAYELGMSVGFIGKVESSRYPTHYNIKHLNSLARILKCSPQDFLPKKPLD